MYVSTLLLVYSSNALFVGFLLNPQKHVRYETNIREVPGLLRNGRLRVPIRDILFMISHNFSTKSRAPFNLRNVFSPTLLLSSTPYPLPYSLRPTLYSPPLSPSPRLSPILLLSCYLAALISFLSVSFSCPLSLPLFLSLSFSPLVSISCSSWGPESTTVRDQGLCHAQ